MQAEIEALFDNPPAGYTEEHFALFHRFRQALNEGRVRAAEPDASSPAGWRVNTWVKKASCWGSGWAGWWICRSTPRASRGSISPPTP